MSFIDAKSIYFTSTTCYEHYNNEKHKNVLREILPVRHTNMITNKCKGGL